MLKSLGSWQERTSYGSSEQLKGYDINYIVFNIRMISMLQLCRHYYALYLTRYKERFTETLPSYLILVKDAPMNSWEVYSLSQLF